MHFQYLTIQSGLGRTEAAAMIDGAEGIEPSAAVVTRDYTVGWARFDCFKETFEKMYSQTGHVTGDDQVPVGFGDAQNRVHAAQGSAVFDEIGHHGVTQRGITVRRTDHRHVSGGLPDALGYVIEQGRMAERKKGFVAAHAGALATGKDVARIHEMMVPHVHLGHDTLGHETGQDQIAVGNNFVYICSLLTIVMLAASPTMAAEVGHVSVRTDAKTFVVRADPRTGRLIRVPRANSSSRTSPKEISDLVEQSAKAHNVDPLLIHSMIKVESDYNVHAVSPKGAEGLMQLTPSTARMLGVSDSFDPGQNIEAGVKYLKYLQSVYKDDRLALAAYNAGPGAVSKYKQIPPYPETQNYVAQVGKRYEDARKSAEKPAVAAQPAVALTSDAHPKLEQFVDENGRLHLRTTQ